MQSTVTEITYQIEHTETIGTTALEIRRYEGPYLPKPLYFVYRYLPFERELLEQVATVRAGQKFLRKWRVEALVKSRMAVERQP